LKIGGFTEILVWIFGEILEIFTYLFGGQERKF